jgi:hypothetical protein
MTRVFYIKFFELEAESKEIIVADRSVNTVEKLLHYLSKTPGNPMYGRTKYTSYSLYERRNEKLIAYSKETELLSIPSGLTPENAPVIALSGFTCNYDIVNISRVYYYQRAFVSDISVNRGYTVWLHRHDNECCKEISHVFTVGFEAVGFIRR